MVLKSMELKSASSIESLGGTIALTSILISLFIASVYLTFRIISINLFPELMGLGIELNFSFKEFTYSLFVNALESTRPSKILIWFPISCHILESVSSFSSAFRMNFL